MFSQTSNTTLQRRPCYATFQSTPTHSLAAQLQQKSCHLTAFLQPFPTCDNHSSGLLSVSCCITCQIMPVDLASDSVHARSLAALGCQRQ